MAQGLSVKLDSFLKPFRGRGDNFQTFWSKFLVLADANGWDTGEKKMAKLPLLLDGAAYTVVDQLSADDKKDPAKVKEALETAFSPSPAEAYHLFVARRLLLDEPVDAYVADLRRLLELSKHAISGDGKDPVLIEQFLSGLPTEVGKTLRLAHAADPHTISQLVSKARTMQSSGGVERAAAAISPSVLCYHCNQVGHLQRNCPRRGGGATGNSGGSGLVVDGPPQQYNIGSWIADLDIRSARIRQHLDEAYATADFMAEPTSKFSDGDRVLLRRPPRSQKRCTPFESGWVVSKHVGPSTVLIRHATRNAEKIVNVELVKPDRSPHEENIAEHPTPDTVEENAGDEEYTLEFSAVQPGSTPRYQLRDRAQLQAPARLDM